MGLGSEIRDPEKTYSGSRIWVQESKRHRILDPGPQHCIRVDKRFKIYSALKKLLIYGIVDPLALSSSKLPTKIKPFPRIIFYVLLPYIIYVMQ